MNVALKVSYVESYGGGCHSSSTGDPGLRVVLIHKSGKIEIAFRNSKLLETTLKFPARFHNTLPAESGQALFVLSFLRTLDGKLTITRDRGEYLRHC